MRFHQNINFCFKISLIVALTLFHTCFFIVVIVIKMHSFQTLRQRLNTRNTERDTEKGGFINYYCHTTV